MQLSWDEILKRAVAFAKRWKETHREKADAQPFVTEFLDVFGVDDPVKVGEREKTVKISGARDKYIDFFWSGQIAIEMKSRGKDLGGAYKQLKDYMDRIPPEEVPDLWMVCDFETIQLWRRSTSEKFSFKLKDFRKHIKRFANIAGYTTERATSPSIEVNIKAAEKMAKLHDALESLGYEGHELEVYLVRLLFCLFAEDTGIFPQNSLYHYVGQSKSDGSGLSDRLARLFEVLNMPEETRAKRTRLPAELKQFRYINGKLFAVRLGMADFDAKMRQTLIECCKFDWSKISPAIFGAMFQGVMDKNQRRELGAHYTSEENILKLINPLFMDELWKEFDRVKTDEKLLNQFHDKIASLKFLDPACGCGNFLIITYRELRLLELEIMKMQSSNQQKMLDVSLLMKVSVEQFYGIECEDFPCQIATVGLWLMDHQMNLQVAEQFGQYHARLPLTQSATIVHANALQLDWTTIISKSELSFILGNPPFNGARMMSSAQKEDMQRVFGTLKGVGNLDYVTAWYKKAADMTHGTGIRTAFVSTNSIAQGEPPAILWKPLMEQGVYINFGVPTFKWHNEAKGKAAVHCVMIGFSYQKTEPNINPYLVEAPTVFIERRVTPLCDVPPMVFGNMPNDGGFLIIEGSDYDDFITREPHAIKYIRRFSMGEEFINNIPRYCLWLKDVAPGELKTMPLVLERIGKCHKTRASSKREATRKLADTPYLFGEIRQPDTDYIAVPKVSSERRRYIPIGMLSKDVIAGDKLFTVPNGRMYHFGILTSVVHMAWMRAVCGRLEMRYSYSNTIVYNNFPWADATEEQKVEIEKLAQVIFDARALFPDSSLADLYDPLTMPPELLKAHQTLDRAVMKLYNFKIKDIPETEIVAKLMERYRELVG